MNDPAAPAVLAPPAAGAAREADDGILAEGVSRDFGKFRALDKVTLRVPRGSLRGVASMQGFDTFETLCESRAADDADESKHVGSHQTPLRPCSAARASVVRLGARAWDVGAGARAGLSFEGEPPASVAAQVALRRDDGGEWSRALSLGL